MQSASRADKTGKRRRKWKSNEDTRPDWRALSFAERRAREIDANHALADRLERLGVTEYAGTLRDCGVSYTTTLCEACGAPHQVVTRCKQRLCVACAAKKSRDSARAVQALASRFDSCKFITLTMRRLAVGELARALDILRAAFKRFRSYGAIARKLRGGVQSVEIVFRPESQDKAGNIIPAGWHVHMHLLCDADFIPHAWLRRLWGKALRQNINGQLDAIVDIQRASPGKLAKYLTKYCTKPADIAGWPDDALVEYCTTIRKRRLYKTFGKYYSLSLSKLLNTPERTPIVCNECNATGTQVWARAGPRHFGKDWDMFRSASRSRFGNWDYVMPMTDAEIIGRYGRIPAGVSCVMTPPPPAAVPDENDEWCYGVGALRRASVTVSPGAVFVPECWL